MNCIYCKSQMVFGDVKVTSPQGKKIAICKDCFETILNNELHCSCCNKKLFDDKITINNEMINDIGIHFIDGNNLFCCRCAEKHKQKQPVVKFKNVERNLKNYSYRPTLNFHKTPTEKSTDMYFGVELEVSGARDSNHIKRFCNSHGGTMFYFKSDGSISGYGFEIVTHPATLDYHLAENSIWTELMKDIKKENLVSNISSNTGIHIHVSRKSLTNDQVKKIDLFVNSYREFWQKISRRKQSNYAQYNMKSHEEWGYNNDRYSSVNFCNAKTVEFRIFNGSTDYKDVMATIESVHATVNFLNNITFDDLYENKTEVINAFKQYANNNGYKFLPNLLKKIKV